jgi:hypothetical protein
MKEDQEVIETNYRNERQSALVLARMITFAREELYELHMQECVTLMQFVLKELKQKYSIRHDEIN